MSAGVAVSLAGRGRCVDNVVVAWLGRAVKYEDLCRRGYAGVLELRQGLGQYLRFDTEERLHQALDYRTPAVVYGGVASTAGLGGKRKWDGSERRVRVRFGRHGSGGRWAGSTSVSPGLVRLRRRCQSHKGSGPGRSDEGGARDCLFGLDNGVHLNPRWNG